MIDGEVLPHSGIQWTIVHLPTTQFVPRATTRVLGGAAVAGCARTMPGRDGKPWLLWNGRMEMSQPDSEVHWDGVL